MGGFPHGKGSLVRGRCRGMPRQSTRAKWCSPSAHPTTVLRSISAEKAIWPPLSTAQVGIYNVTFEPGCRNNWHIHHAAKGGGQILVCVAGRGYYQEWDKAPQELHPGDVVNIPRRSSTGTVLHPIAGSLIRQWKCPAKAPLTSGASRCRKKPIRSCGDKHRIISAGRLLYELYHIE